MPDVLPLLTAIAGVALGALAAWLWSRRALRALSLHHEQQLQQALTAARTDPLTGLWNRRAFDEQLARETAIARRYDSGCAVLLIDIDELKSINDGFGHAVGDAALRRLADGLQSGSREADFAARFGGDEFALLLPQTDVAGALCVAFRFLKSLNDAQAAAAIPGAGKAGTGKAGTGKAGTGKAGTGKSGAAASVPRASLGVAALLPDESAAELLRRADLALYGAKQAGGGQVWWHNGREAGKCTSAT
jgi:diguanylate cyclase (GGDEF)-like protein